MLTPGPVGRARPNRSRRRFITGLATLPLLVSSCAFDRRRVGSDDVEGSQPTEEPASNGRLSTRPRQPETVTPTPPGVETLDLGEGGRALVYIPVEHRPDRPSPTVVLFHGAGGRAEDALGLLRPLADEAGMIVVAPQSRRRTWDLVLDDYGPDVALLDEALGQVFGRYVVDPAHLGVAGFSDGASYALSVGAINGDLFSDVIAFSPGFWAAGDVHGSPSFFVTHGTDDKILPIDSTSRRLVPRLERAGYDVTYVEFDGGHVVPGELAAESVTWFLS